MVQIRTVSVGRLDKVVWRRSGQR